MPITASVGMVDGSTQCYNVASDQEIVQDLLNNILLSAGGAGHSLSDPIQWGVVSPSLYQAIINFQTSNGLSVDGHVDPHGSAIARMEALSAGAPAGTSETAPGGLAEGPIVRECGPMREVASGFLPASFMIDGGPDGTVIVTGAPGAQVEVDVRTPGGIGTVYINIDDNSVSASMPFNTHAPPPVTWSIGLTQTAGVPAGLRFSFETDWACGEPPCTPP